MPSELSLRRAAGAVSVVGIGVATYIAVVEAGGGAPACVAGGGGCETVANSTYSHLAGINVAVLGIAGYVMVLVASVLRGDAARFGALLLALAGFGFSAYLTYLELFVIEAICQWCVASAVLMTILLCLTAWRAFAYAGSEIASGGHGGDSSVGGAT
ncbi:MAG: vitamin K epoxide reductase family protein [Solirubrobacterales bacterium]